MSPVLSHFRDAGTLLFHENRRYEQHLRRVEAHQPLFNAFIYQTIVGMVDSQLIPPSKPIVFHSSPDVLVTATRLNKERDKRLNGQVPDLY